MNAVSTYYEVPAYPTTRSRSAKPALPLHNRFQPKTSASTAAGKKTAVWSLRAIRLGMLTAVILISFCMGIVVHMISGNDEVQAASLPTASALSATTAPAQPITAHKASEQSDKPKVIVGIGDTLWSIAEAHASKGADIRGYIQKLKQVNHLSSSALQAGQVLQLP